MCPVLKQASHQDVNFSPTTHWLSKSATEITQAFFQGDVCECWNGRVS